jgi:hypothetical protein
MSVKLSERGVLMGRQYNRTITPLTNVGQVLGVDEQAEFAKGLFAKKP